MYRGAWLLENTELCYDPLRVSSASVFPKGHALIFDLDGVIIDSNPIHVQVWDEYLRLHGIDPGNGLPERMYGRRNEELVRDLFGANLTPEEARTHGAAKEALYRKRMAPQLRQRLVPGVVEFIGRHRGTPTGLATNAEPANVEFVLTGTGLYDSFSVVVDGHMVERPKPDPEVYLRAASMLGVSPQDCVVFEDSLTGVASALAAGAKVVALRTTHSSFPGAELVIDNFLSQDLELWLGRTPVRR